MQVQLDLSNQYSQVRENFIGACKKCDLEKITSLVANSILTPKDIQDGLEYVTYFDSLEAVKIIINQHPDINTKSAIFVAQKIQTPKILECFRELERKKSQPTLDFIKACENGNVIEVKALIHDPKIDADKAIVKACLSGHIDVVKILLNNPRFNPADNVNGSLYSACHRGQVEIVKLLLSDPRIDPSRNTDDCSLLIAASRSGQVEVLKVLLQDLRINLAKDADTAIKKAIKNGHLEFLKVLTEDSRILYIMDKNKALNIALEYEQQEIYQFLFEVKSKSNK